MIDLRDAANLTKDSRHPDIAEPDLNSHDRSPFALRIEAYGVTIAIKSNSEEQISDALKTANQILADRLTVLDECAKCEHAIDLFVDGDLFSMSIDGELIDETDSRVGFGNLFDSRLRLTIAEHAKEYVFVHAGSVGWKGMAIIIPARSFAGKSTLTAEFVKAGAEYYSDEYAVIDQKGFVHPFPRMISLRPEGEEFTEEFVPIEYLGGKTGSDPLRIGTILLTEYVDGAEWAPELLSLGSAMIKIIPHTIPVSDRPQFSMSVLAEAIKDANIYKGPRGEASDFAELFLKFIDNKTE